MYKFSKYILLQNHWIYPLCAKGLPRGEICNSDARCRKTWTHALAALERSRLSIDLVCLYLLTNNMLEAVYMLLIYMSVSFHLDSASTFNEKPTQPSLQPSNEGPTHDHTTLEHLGESLLDGVGADLGGTVAISISVGSRHCCIMY